MNRATLKRRNGEPIAVFDLPETNTETPLSRYISFLNEMKKFELEDINPIQVMAQAVGEFTGVELGDILQAKIGDEWEKDRQLDGGVRSLYGWIVNTLTNWKGEARSPNDFTFEYKGDKYKIPYLVSSEIAGGLPTLQGNDIETNDAVEAFETIRMFDQSVKSAGDPKGERAKRIAQLKGDIVKNGDESGDKMREMKRLEAQTDHDGDPNGNLMFARYLRMIAILARKEGERLPTNDGDRERWIQTRMLHFQEIDTKTALDVDFFLIGLLMLSKRTHPVIGSLIHPLFGLAVANQSRQQQSAKPTIKRYRTKRKYKSALAGVR